MTPGQLKKLTVSDLKAIVDAYADVLRGMLGPTPTRVQTITAETTPVPYRNNVPMPLYQGAAKDQDGQPGKKNGANLDPGEEAEKAALLQQFGG